MAEDAAGAVRRTQDLIDTAVKAIVANPNLVAAVVKACKCCTSDHYEPGGGAPYPAECRWCDHEPNRHGEAELAKLRIPVMDSLGDLLASPDQRRPVVLLRAEDCACPVGGDCPHGPEPVDALDLTVWLHAEVQHQHAELLAQRDSWWDHVGREQAKIVAERDEAVALCANLQTTILSRLAELTEAAGKARSTEWLRACATLPMEEWPPAPAYKGPMVPAAELEEARAKIEKLTACAPPTGSEEWGLAKRLSYDLMAVDLGFHSESSEQVAHLIRHGWRPAGHTELQLEAKLDAARLNASDAAADIDELPTHDQVAARGRQEPRHLLGYTVPDHIQWSTFGRWVNLSCRGAACTLDGQEKRFLIPALGAATEAIEWMKAHAHGGEVVEYRSGGVR